ncbi:hypothetical protein M0R45_007505 [Rubus argutus]|uniref:F-box domain-containing protein n=1 Tax=Rubus argutus TaxID=59490 RepID=A0AAW1XZD6_RUBAR
MRGEPTGQSGSKRDVKLDRISNLPSDVTEKILSRLPIRDAVRTNVLSRQWRYKSGHTSTSCFKSLKALQIDNATMSQDVLENMIVSCPLLATLTLIDCDGFTHLKVNATCLRTLAVIVRVPGTCSNLVNFFVHLPQIRDLGISKYFLKYLAVGGCPRKLARSCRYLRYLNLRMSFSNKDEVLTALCLLRSSPTLERLEIFSDHAAVEVENNYSLLDDNHNCVFSELRLVEIKGVSGAKAELDFIKFLLLSSPTLKSMKIKPASADGSLELLKKLLEFGRVSVNSKIIYLAP